MHSTFTGLMSIWMSGARRFAIEDSLRSLIREYPTAVSLRGILDIAEGFCQSNVIH